MQFAVYADLSRRLAEHERSTLFEALDADVPGSGCVGLQKGPNDEVYFVLEALSEEQARAQAAHCMNLILQKALVEVEYALTLQRMHAA
ncbi:MAG: hypothetical protein J0L73_28130 [Verrucomicrobia bacterium]|nr:hypothetical protein [Verrucomicrobiota bacterium]